MNKRGKLMKCFYHTDMDGKASAAIVYNYYNKNVECIPINYAMKFPFDSVESDEDVIIVDFSLKPDDMEKLLQITSNITWIDHHATAIENLKDFDLKGLRSIDKAGCQLVWEYYHDEPEPWAIKYIGDHDIWKFEYGDDTRAFMLASRLKSTKPDSLLWDRWLHHDLDKYDSSEDVDIGYTLLEYQKQWNEDVAKSWSFKTSINGHTAIACNAVGVNSSLFDSIEDEYDIKILFRFNGEMWVVSLFSDNNIDVSKIAKSYGGGGHKGAAGFTCKELPFSKE